MQGQNTTKHLNYFVSNHLKITENYSYNDFTERETNDLDLNKMVPRLKDIDQKQLQNVGKGVGKTH